MSKQNTSMENVHKKNRGKRHGRPQLFLAAILVAAILIGAYLIFARDGASTGASDPAIGDLGAPQATTTAAGDADAATAPAAIAGGARYIDPSGFSIYVPAGYQAAPSHDSGVETILIGKSDGSEPGKSIQIYITPYDEPASQFDTARIYKDIPNQITRNAREFSIADGHGVEFDDASGHEIWFAADGQLYQMTSPASLAPVAERIAASFKLQ